MYAITALVPPILAVSLSSIGGQMTVRIYASDVRPAYTTAGTNITPRLQVHVVNTNHCMVCLL